MGLGKYAFVGYNLCRGKISITLPIQTRLKTFKNKPVSRIACPEVPSVLLNLLRTDPTSEALTSDLYEALMKSDLITSDQRSEWYERWVHPIANISSESLHQMSLPVLVKLLSRANTLTNGDVYRALLSGSNESGVVPNATFSIYSLFTFFLHYKRAGTHFSIHPAKRQYTPPNKKSQKSLENHNTYITGGLKVRLKRVKMPGIFNGIICLPPPPPHPIH